MKSIVMVYVILYNSKYRKSKRKDKKMDKIYFVINFYGNIIFLTENENQAIEVAKKRNQALVEQGVNYYSDGYFNVGVLDTHVELPLGTTYVDYQYDEAHFCYPEYWNWNWKTGK